jgi:omega-3 fatty acid desaturase (delta-15 desaturase)
MAPCVLDVNTKAGKEATNALNLASIRKAIPEEAFKKSTFVSSQYMIRDYACWLGSVYGIYLLCTSSLWGQMPFWQQAGVTFLYWIWAGFFMWCMFMIGHDCGHTTFSGSELINDVVGLIAHGSLLVPFHPWQVRIVYEPCRLVFFLLT